MTQWSLRRLVLVLAAGFALAACTTNFAGFGKQPPDEFRIVSRAPLAMPPSLDNLAPPSPGENRPQELQPGQQAQVALFGHTLASAGGMTAGEDDLLAQAGTQNNMADIRTVIDREHAELQNDMTVGEYIAFWRDAPDPTAVVIDPPKEEQRLQNNAALGLPPNAGDFEGVIIVPKEKALLEGVF